MGLFLNKNSSKMVQRFSSDVGCPTTLNLTAGEYQRLLVESWYGCIKRRLPSLLNVETKKTPLRGVKAVRPNKLASMSRREKTVSRVYGGTLCHKAVRERIVRAFLIEEQKIVARVLKAQEGKKR